MCKFWNNINGHDLPLYIDFKYLEKNFITVKNKTLPLQNSLRFSSIALHGRDKTLKSKYETDVGLYVLSDRIKSLHGRVFVLLSRVKTLCTSEEAFIIRAPSIRIGITDTKQTIPVDSKNLKRNQVFSTK